VLTSQKGFYSMDFVLCFLVYTMKKAVVAFFEGRVEKLWTILDILK